MNERLHSDYFKAKINTGLAFCFKFNNLTITKILIDKYSKIIKENNSKFRIAFKKACEYNNIDIVKLVADMFPKLIYNYSYNGYVGFDSACRYNNIKVVELLLDRY